MAGNDRNIEINIEANDEASKVLEDVADLVDDLGDETVEVDVEADTREALSNIEKFDQQVEGLTDEAREVRIEFKQAALEAELKKALRLIERLEDPVEIDVQQGNIERTLSDLEDLDRLASEKYQVDIDVDPNRSARQAADDLGSVNSAAEGFQSGLPALRGFGDELGETAQKAGVAGQALGDLGDFSLIAGERFGLNEQLAGQLGAALGAAGLAAVVGGVLYEAYGKLTDAQDINLASAEDLLEIQEALAEGAREDAARKLVDSYRELISIGEDYGVSAADTIANITAEMYKLDGDQTKITDNGREGWNNYRDAVYEARGQFSDARTDFQETEEAVTAVSDSLGGVAGNAEDAIVAIKQTADGVFLLSAAQNELGEDATPEELVERYGELKSEVDEAKRGFSAAGDAGEAAGDQIAGGVDDATEAVEDLSDEVSELDGLLGTLDAEKAGIKLAESFAEATGEGELTRLELIDLQEETARYLTQLGGIPDEKITDVLALIDDGSIAEAQAEINRLTINRDIVFNVKLRYPPGAIGIINSGGVVPGYPGPQSLPVGVGPAIPSPLAINVRTDASMRQVDRAIQRWHRLNGGG